MRGEREKTYKAPTKVFFLFCTADEILLKAPFLFKWKIREIEIFITQALEKRNIMKKKICVKNFGNDLARGFFVGFISDDNRSIINDLLVSSRS